jgi:hypothetical protein
MRNYPERFPTTPQHLRIHGGGGEQLVRYSTLFMPVMFVIADRMIRRRDGSLGCPLVDS